jgi:hypothetical protein
MVFLMDCHLMWANAFAFNHESSQIHMDAAVLQKVFIKAAWQQFPSHPFHAAAKPGTEQVVFLEAYNQVSG